MLRIGIDLGGTKIAAGLVDENRVLGPSIQEPTGLPRPAGELAEAIYHLAYRLLKEQGLTFQDVESVGIGIPGTVNKETDCIEYANNFGFENVPFLKMLRSFSHARFMGKMTPRQPPGANIWPVRDGEAVP